ncbi:MAG: HD domain-containing protein [Bacteroidaceae bacterium]|nr:HD domain-containing protein [Bacteroidaceae bacterium]
MNFELNDKIFNQLSATADELGYECYVVGGYVRDLIINRPSKDIDVVVVGSGIKMAEAFAKHIGLKSGLSVFKNFGTAQIKWHGIEVEFVGARKESYQRDSRKPIVEDGTLADDQNRRDFTINAMAICLNANRYGELVDPFDGLGDIETKTIRTPLDPDITFSDDPLRMMRCIRFATQLNYAIEDETFEALCRNKDRIKIISQERIITELNKIMESSTPSRGLVDLQRCGLMAYILPELAALDCVETRRGRAHKNNFYHTLEVVDNVALKSDNLYLRWAALLHDIGKPKSKKWDDALGWTFHNHNFIGKKMVKNVFHRLKLPLDDRLKYVEKLVDLHMRPIAIADDTVTDSAVRRLGFEARPDIEDLMMLCEADITSKNERKKQNFLNNFALVRQKMVEIQAKDKKNAFQPIISGNDIMNIFNLQPSREVGVLKQALKEARWNEEIEGTYEAELQFLIDLAKTINLEPTGLN